MSSKLILIRYLVRYIIEVHYETFSKIVWFKSFRLKAEYFAANLTSQHFLFGGFHERKELGFLCLENFGSDLLRKS